MHVASRAKHRARCRVVKVVRTWPGPRRSRLALQVHGASRAGRATLASSVICDAEPAQRQPTATAFPVRRRRSRTPPEENCRSDALDGTRRRYSRLPPMQVKQTSRARKFEPSRFIAAGMLRRAESRVGTTSPPVAAQALADPKTKPAATYPWVQCGCVDRSQRLIMLVGGETDCQMPHPRAIRPSTGGVVTTRRDVSGPSFDVSREIQHPRDAAACEPSSGGGRTRNEVE